MSDRGKNILIFRLRLFVFLLVASYLAVGYKVFFLQVLNAQDLKLKAAKEIQRILKLKPVRGTIYDRNRRELALSVEVDSVFAHPAKVNSPDAAARVLAPVLEMKESGLRASLASKKPFVWLKRWVSPRVSEQVTSLEIEGIHLKREPRRFYPRLGLAGHLIGFVGVDGIGLEGLEKEFDQLLRGKSKNVAFNRDARGKFILTGGLPHSPTPYGKSLVLTIDDRIQHIAERELAEGIKSSGAKDGSAVVMDPSTGQVLAIANYPPFNPNVFKSMRPSRWRNRAVTDYFEPGSTVKVFLVAAALDSGAVGIKDLIYCENGSYRFLDHVIHDVHPYRWLSIAGVVKHSSNIGAAKVAQKVGPKALHRYLWEFGFGTPTGIDFPGETSGLLRPPRRWWGTDIAAVAFGHSFAVSNIQLAAAISTIANGGVAYKPYLVREILGEDGKVLARKEPQAHGRVISTKTARYLNRILMSVTEEGGTGSQAAVPGYKTAGKTGTSRKLDRKTGTYASDRHMASFVGYVPAKDPALVISVVINDPTVGSHYGGVVAGPVFRRIAGQALHYLKVLPRGPVRMVNLKKRPVTQASAETALKPVLGGLGVQ